jgi:hypothetical protein
MADRVLFIGWKEPARGREDRAVEVFNDAVGILGRKQQEGAIEGFNIVLLQPNEGLAGFMTVEGTAAQLSALQEDPEFQRNTVDATLNVDGICHIDGWTNEGVGTQMEMYTEAVARV